MNIKTRIEKFIPLIILGVSLILYLLSIYAPDFMACLYPLWAYKLVSQGFSNLLFLFPFSVAELLLLLAPIGCIYLLGKGLYLSIIRNKTAGAFWRRTGRRSWKLGCYLLSAFILFAGINYHRKSLVDYLELNVEPVQKEELVQVCNYLVDLTNDAVLHTARNKEGRFIPSYSFAQKRKLIGYAYDSLSVSFPSCRGQYPSSKPLLFSRWVSYTRIGGFFFPFTFEANVNKDIPDFMIPSVIAHEQAHVRGFMREEEAEYTVFLLARYTPDTELRYSFYLSTLMRAIGTLRRVDNELYKQSTERFSDVLVNDLNVYADYWRAFQSPVGTLSRVVNDAYLKANSQSDGVQSYGRVVELLIADYKQFQTIKNQYHEDEHR